MEIDSANSNKNISVLSSDLSNSASSNEDKLMDYLIDDKGTSLTLGYELQKYKSRQKLICMLCFEKRTKVAVQVAQ